MFIEFSVSYLVASLATYVIDINYPQMRSDSGETSPERELGAEYIKILSVSIPNIISSAPFFYLYETYLDDRENDNHFLVNLLGWLMITDISFYIFHRLLHHPKLYKYHKLHHSYRYTYGPSALYSSFTEFYLSNLLPNIIAFECLCLSKNEACYIIIFETFYTVIISHGGYRLFGESHLKHHLFYKEPYGLFMTDKISSFLAKRTLTPFSNS